MSTKRIDDRNIGAEHNELAEVGRRLKVDGEDALADRYFRRAQAAQEVYVHLRGIGDEALAVANAKLANHERGVDVANWLINEGWTPPNWVPLLDEPHPATLDDVSNIYF